GRADLRELDRQPIDRFARQRRTDDVVEPAVALLVCGQHGDARRLVVGAGPDQLGARLLFDLPAHLGRLAETRLNHDRRTLLEVGDDAGAQLLPELVDLGGDLEIIGDDRAAFLNIEVLHLDVQGRHREERGRVALDEIGETVGRLLDEYAHARALQLLLFQLVADLLQLVERRRRLPRRRAAGDDLPHIVFDVVERRA